ncbi:MAG: DUF5615 family PIN-like protein [Nitrospira sp.]|nr:DUF5615 family PIN-like protein [Nitrospira sp.]
MKRNLRFMVDAGVGKNIEAWLQSEGFDTVAIRDLDPRMSDTVALELAFSESRIVITMDKDFGELVYHRKQKHSGVILLRMEDARIDEKLSAVQKIIDQHGELIHGSFSTYQDGKLRIRK